MKSEQQLIKIAEACGHSNPRMGVFGRYYAGELPHLEEVPDYLSDLNAMHEAENTMGDPQLWLEYDTNLAKVMDHVGWKWHSTAAQRAEAFLRTLNLWTED